MRSIISFIILCLVLHPNVFAQKYTKPSLEIILSDHSALQLSINGKLFNKVNNKLIIRDLPARTNYIEVIKKCNRKIHKNCKDEIVFTGKIKFEKNKHYQAVVLVNEGKLMLSDKGNLIPPQLPETTSEPSSSHNDEVFVELAELKKNLSPSMQALGARMKDKLRDTDKMEEAKKYLQSQKSISTNDAIVISSWILYDEHRLEFLKQSLPYISDKNEFRKAAMVFTMNEMRDAFYDFCDENL